jgi:protein tyrosine/serine phosphatase
MKSLSLLVFVLVSSFRPGLAASSPAADVRNFGEVNDHLYRGAAPSAVGLQELGAMGIKLVIDLRETGRGTSVERAQVEKLGIRYVNIPLRPTSAPTQEEISHLLSLLSQNGTSRIFVHCRRGKDRTGTVVACYRIQHDGWTNRKAQAEANEYGMSRMERGMRSFIVHFTPTNPLNAAQMRRVGN